MRNMKHKFLNLKIWQMFSIKVSVLLTLNSVFAPQPSTPPNVRVGLNLGQKQVLNNYSAFLALSLKGLKL